MLRVCLQMLRLRSRKFAAVLIAVLAIGVHPEAAAADAAIPVLAHPMPNTVIALSVDDDGVTIDVAVPLPELKLAMQGDWPSGAREMDSEWQRAITIYLMNHFAMRSISGEMQPWTLRAVKIWETTDSNVGRYQELRFRVDVEPRENFDVRHFVLVYDAVIHQIPNHFALVQITQDFRGGILTEERAVDVGVIRFDFARNTTPELRVDVDSGSNWKGLRSMIAIGFHHVIGGFDHLLFLATLLIVAPIRVEQKRWSLFQGWKYATSRFLAISFSFTLGHSFALFAGAYEIFHVSPNIVEVLIAVSIVVTAVHAIVPLFEGWEWLVAASFGTVHGLAFAEGIAGLNMSPATRALAVGGFNVGVEAAQIVAMLCAIPLLLLSRWRLYHAVRITSMSVAVVLATMWAIQRAGLTDSPNIVAIAP